MSSQSHHNNAMMVQPRHYDSVDPTRRPIKPGVESLRAPPASPAPVLTSFKHQLIKSRIEAREAEEKARQEADIRNGFGFKSIPKRKIKKSKTKTRSQHAKKVSRKMKKVSTRKTHSQHAKKVRKTRSDKGMKRGPRKA
jgi:hypothetical protein